MREKRGQNYPGDKTFLQAKVARSLAAQYGTPLFIYDRATLEAQVAGLNRAFSWNDGHRGVYPVRQLHHPEILKIIHGAGCLILCCNATELRLAAMAGIPGKDILFSAFFPDAESLDLALSGGATMILNQGEQLEDIPLREYGDRILVLRLNEEEMRRELLKTRRNAHTKLGMFTPEAVETICRAAARGCSRFALSMVSGSAGYTAGTMTKITEYLLSVSQMLFDKLGVRIQWCHIGGNMNWPTVPVHTALSIEHEAEDIRSKYEVFVAGQEQKDMPLYTQIGPYLTMPAGVLLTRCLGRKKDDITYMGVDIASSHMPRAVDRGIHYHVSKVGDHRLEGRQTVHLAGQLQERDDILAKMQCLPPLRTGDLLLVHDVGAYGRSDSSNYGGTLRCPEVLLDSGVPRLITRRETFADYIACLQGDQQEHQEAHHNRTQAEGNGDVQKPGDAPGESVPLEGGGANLCRNGDDSVNR